MTDTSLYRRFIYPRLIEALTDSPVVLVHGPRQCGKTTLARMAGDSAGYTYISFDDDVLRSAAKSDPVGFVSDLHHKVILDEVQRVPELFTSLKAAVDRDRTPGRFILTGSANILLLPNLADSLAGRMEILRLHPLSQAELAGEPPNFLDALFHIGFKTSSHQRLGQELCNRIVAGGYPAALTRSTPRRRATWYRDYIETLVQRDVRHLARISSLDALPRLLSLAAGQSSHLLNVADLASPFQLSRPTIRDYLTLLNRIFLVDELSPWFTNRLSRLIKTPKLHLGDTGVASALLAIDAESLYADRKLFGQLLETFVFQELRRQASWYEEPVAFYHFRDKDGVEVDLVLEGSGQRLAGIEIKASATVTSSDFRGLKKLQEAAAERFAAGVILYDGESAVSFGKGMYAIPIRCLWELR